MDIWRIRPSGGTPETVTDHGAPVNFVTPLDARTLLFVAPAEDRSGPWLWSLDVQSKQTRRVTTGVEQYLSVAASADGRRIVATVANGSASLWSVPVLDRVADERDMSRSRCRACVRSDHESTAGRCSTCRRAALETDCGAPRKDRRPKSGRVRRSAR